MVGDFIEARSFEARGLDVGGFEIGGFEARGQNAGCFKALAYGKDDAPT